MQLSWFNQKKLNSESIDVNEQSAYRPLGWLVLVSVYLQRYLYSSEKHYRDPTVFCTSRYTTKDLSENG